MMNVNKGTASRRIVARAPTRIDFGGSLTDVPPYPEREGGAACCVAITRYATATVKVRTDAGGDVPGDVGFSDLVAASLARLSIRSGLIRLERDYPIGAGLGGSSAASVALVGGLSAFKDGGLRGHELAALSRDIEVNDLGIPGGYQDHYAASLGGAQLQHFGNESVQIEALPLPAQFSEDMARRSLVVYTGESRASVRTVLLVRDAYCQGTPHVLAALARMRALACEMAAAMRAGDIDALGALVGEHWVHQRALHPAISTERIDAIIEVAAKAGALGSKALGASGGGSVLVVAADGREEAIAKALQPLGDRIAYAVAAEGFSVTEAM